MAVDPNSGISYNKLVTPMKAPEDHPVREVLLFLLMTTTQIIRRELYDVSHDPK